MKILQTIVLSLAIGAIFGWAFSTKFPVHIAAWSGAAAAAFMFGGLAIVDRIERRNSCARAPGGDDRDETRLAWGAVSTGESGASAPCGRPADVADARGAFRSPARRG